jgi:hypothetical protein
MGTWIEKFPNGSGMVTVFAPDSISAYPAAPDGHALQAPFTAKVSYKDLGPDDVGVEFDGPDRGGLLLHWKSADVLIMDFPGQGAHELTRVPAAKGAGDASRP